MKLAEGVGHEGGMFSSTSSRKHLLLAACALLSTVTTACLEPTVIGGTDSSGGAGGAGGSGGVNTGGSGGVGGTVTPSGYDGVVFDAADEPWGGEPGTLTLELGSETPLCADPTPSGGNGCPTEWHLTVVLGPSRQAPGVYMLPDPDITTSFTTEGHGPDPNTCMASLGMLTGGTLEVVSSDATGLSVTLSGVPEVEVNGTHDLFHCGGVGPVGQTEAIALYASQFPPDNGGDSSSSTSGGGVDPDTLHVILGNYGPTCGDPFGFNEDCTVAEWHVGVSLPLAYQTPGIYDLADPNLNSFASEQLPSNDPEICSGGGGSFTDGTIEVVSILPTELLVRFNGVSAHASELQQDIRIPRCP
ncbi:hypothetical protein [Chondromyces apiculatus]|uniref:Uncharacterized protein n=1 Tax=Chondromyces apiculatus DSM 436 TaxID=1192034 RepID=A0A017SUS9_9BACT|nr:hypothetical protein [Chondromyces apiculatus]EYF00748.1 Hypothetical protein CAP_0316 [Chondromyces apiculatus DSM 436]